MGTRSKWRIQEDRKTSRKSTDNKFPLLKCSYWKRDVWNECTKTKGLYEASKYLVCKRLPKLKCPGSFNDKFHPSKLLLNHTTRSSSTYQLKTERYGHKSVVKKNAH